MTSSIQPMDSSNTPLFVIDAGEAYTPPQFTDQDHCGIKQSSFSELHTEHFAGRSTPYYVALVKNKNKGSALFDLTGFVNWDHSQSKFINPMGNAIIERVTILGINALKTVTTVAECTSKADFQREYTQYVPQAEITSSLINPDALLEDQLLVDRALRNRAREVMALFAGLGGMCVTCISDNKLMSIANALGLWFECWKGRGQEENRRIKNFARLAIAFGGTVLGAFMAGGSVLTSMAIQGAMEIAKEMALPRMKTMIFDQVEPQILLLDAAFMNRRW